MNVSRKDLVHLILLGPSPAVGVKAEGRRQDYNKEMQGQSCHMQAKPGDRAEYCAPRHCGNDYDCSAQRGSGLAKVA